MVAPMNQSIPELIAQRQGALGAKTLLALYRRLPAGDDRITYETLRNLANGRQRGTRDGRVIRDLAVMLDVQPDVVRKALRADPDFGEWELPPRAQALDPQERTAVVSVIDAILRAKRAGGGSSADTGEPRKKSPEADEDQPAKPVTLAEIKRQRLLEQAMPEEEAARDGEPALSDDDEGDFNQDPGDDGFNQDPGDEV